MDIENNNDERAERVRRSFGKSEWNFLIKK